MRAGERRFVTLVLSVGLVVPGLLALSCMASVSGRAGGGGAYLTVSLDRSALFCLWLAITAFLLRMSVQSVEIKDACRTWRAKDGNSYYVTLSHVCRDGRIGTGVGKPMVGLPPAFGLGRN